MSLVLMFFITYAVVLAIALVFTAVLCPRKSSLFVTFKDAAPITAAITFAMVFLILTMFVGAVYIYGNLYYPQHCHGCGSLSQMPTIRWTNGGGIPVVLRKAPPTILRRHPAGNSRLSRKHRATLPW